MIVLFTPPRVFEERKPYAYSGAQRGKTASAFAGLGNVVDDILAPIVGGATNIIDTLTGAKAARNAQASAVEIAKAQADAQVATTQARAAEFKSIAPWVGLAAVAIVLAVTVLKK